MTFALTFIGGLIGLSLAGFAGLLGGGAIGFLLGRVAKLTDQLKALQGDYQGLRDSLNAQNPELFAAAQAVPPSDVLEPDAADFFDPPSDSPLEPPQETPYEPLPAIAPGSVPLALTPTGLPVFSSVVLSAPAAAGAASFGGSAADEVGNAPVDGWLSKAYRFLTEGNVVAKIGVIVLFFGLAFLLKYAADRAIFPIELRLVLVGLGGVVLLSFGWFLRQRHTGYALVLQGGGIGVLYLTLFAAFRLYSLLPPGFTLGLMLLVVFAAAVLAIVQDAKSLAMLGITGGFLAPILAGSDTGSHVHLFSYYLILNFGIVFIAWRKAWRALNLIAFLFTFVIGTLWGVLRYQPELFATTEPFLIGFFMIFLATAILFARQQLVQGRPDYVQSTLIFGPPLAGFGLQALLVSEFDYGLAWSALLLGLLYLLLSVLLRRVQVRRYQILTDAFLALGIGFVTLAVPLAFDGQWTSITWALEGVAMLWVGLRQARKKPVIFGLLLQLAAGLAFADDVPSQAAQGALLNGLFLSGGLIGLAGLASAYLLRKNPRGVLLAVWGLAWWLGVGFYDLAVPSTLSQPFTLWLLFAVVSLLLLNLTRLAVADWPFLRAIPAVMLALMWVLGLLILALNRNPWTDYAGWVWLVAFAGFYGLMYAHERREEPVYGLAKLHVLGLWLLTLVLIPIVADAFFRWGFGYSVRLGWLNLSGVTPAGAWQAMSYGLVPALMLLWLGRARHWPFGERFGHAVAYRSWAAAGLILSLFVWLLTVNGEWLSNERFGALWAMPASIAYLPVFNGVDLVSLLAMAISFWSMQTQRVVWSLPVVSLGRWVLGGAAFLWLNAVIARSLNAYADLPLYDWQFLSAALAQTTYSIAWSLLGLSLIFIASRKVLRSLWWVAAGLLGVVVLKLFAVDLSGSDTVARIVSFIGVGILLLLAGYVAPMPAKRGVNPP
jgi:uncharacterized membrane protein